MGLIRGASDGEKIKVLHIGEYVHGGVATYLKTLIQGAEKYGIETYLLMSKYKSETRWNIEADRLFFYPYERSISHVFSAMIDIHRCIEQIKPDVIHVHSSWAGLFVRLPYLFKKKRAKIIYTPHGWAFLMDTSGMKKKVYGIIECILSFTTDQIINISNYEKNKAIEFGLPANKITMIYNGVIETKPDKKSVKVHFDKDKINLLFVGRIDRTKGLDLFLDVYQNYAFPNIHLYIIGDSVLDRYELKSDSKTTYLGWIENDVLDAYYQACDAVIMPSRWEGFGLTAIEAMRNSKAVIASNRGALPEIVEACGYIYDIEIEQELKIILEQADKSSLKYLGRKGYRRYKAMFTAEKFCSKTITIQKNML